MGTEIIGFIGIGIMLLLLVFGLPVAFAAGITGFLGIWFLAGLKPAITQIGTVPFSVPASYALTVIPLFIIMGYFAFNAGLPQQAFETGKKWLGHIPGGLAMATITGCAAFAACTGATVASAAVFSKVAIPEMEKIGYSPRLAAGVVAASGTFACMIPPSGLMVMYAIMAEVSVGKALIAGLFPGLVTAVFYSASLYLRVRRNPRISGGILPPASWRDRMISLPPLWGVFIMAFSIIGGIFLGIFTPTEAGAVGAAVGFILLMTKRNISKWPSLKDSLLDTGLTTAMVLFILIGVIIFANFLALSRLTNFLVDTITGFSVNRYVVLVGFMVLYIIGGMFLNSTPLLLLSMPVIYPVVMKFGFDPFWFGILVMKTIEVGQVTPPVGLTAYVVHGVARHIPLEDIFRGTLPFILMDFVVLALVMIFPQIALFLPNHMK